MFLKFLSFQVCSTMSLWRGLCPSIISKYLW